jgi:hypothetical protein
MIQIIIITVIKRKMKNIHINNNKMRRLRLRLHQRTSYQPYQFNQHLNLVHTTNQCGTTVIPSEHPELSLSNPKDGTFDMHHSSIQLLQGTNPTIPTTPTRSEQQQLQQQPTSMFQFGNTSTTTSSSSSYAGTTNSNIISSNVNSSTTIHPTHLMNPATSTTSFQLGDGKVVESVTTAKIRRQILFSMIHWAKLISISRQYQNFNLVTHYHLVVMNRHISVQPPLLILLLHQHRILKHLKMLVPCIVIIVTWHHFHFVLVLVVELFPILI